MLRIIILVFVLAWAPALQAHDHEAHIQDAIDNPARSAANRARDEYRNPLETLSFFGLRPYTRVVEITPGGGWYREIIEHVVADQGAYYPFNFRGGRWPEEPVDMILTFRNVHNWFPPEQVNEVFQLFYDHLAPGGTLGVVEHRWPEDGDDAQQGNNGYVKQSVVMAAAKAAGFQFVAASDINNNPKDTKDHPRGVWTLPPTLALRDEDREKYLAIGESDRFTLKFVKPQQAAAR